jgi:hypothetical protein
MFRRIEKATVLSVMKKLLIAGLLGYGAVTTVLLLRLKPQPLLIGVDQYGTRVIRESGDRLLKSEKANFLKRFMALLYSYDSETFEKRISDCGDLMTETLWKQKMAEFTRIAAQLKTEPLTQTAEVVELREIEAATYQADLVLRVQRRLAESKIKLRVEFRVRPNVRRENNPYPFEVESYDESQGS